MNIWYVLAIFTGGGTLGAVVCFFAVRAHDDRISRMWELKNPLHASFLDFTDNWPEVRFWQALCSWSGYTILASPRSLIMAEIHCKECDYTTEVEYSGFTGSPQFHACYGCGKPVLINPMADIHDTYYWTSQHGDVKELRCTGESSKSK